MIVQACINGARPESFHPCLPLTSARMADDAAACVRAGAAEIHVHPRANGKESLAAVDETILAIRQACPGTLVGVSTGAWIENDMERTRSLIAQWTMLPDYASVNLSEPDAPAIMALLDQKGVGVEAGIATVADAERFVALPNAGRCLRILIEIDEPDWPSGHQFAVKIESILQGADIRRPILLHGFDGTVWPFVNMAAERRYSTRIGLEDSQHMPDGSDAHDNAALVSAAVSIFRSAGATMAQSSSAMAAAGGPESN